MARDIFLTCEHVINPKDDPHQAGDSYYLAANLTGTSGGLYSIDNPQLGKDIHLFPNVDLAIIKVQPRPDQPYVSLEYGDVWEGEDVGVVGYPLARLGNINGNISFDGLIYRAARGQVSGRFTTDVSVSMKAVPLVEVNFLFVPGNSGGPVFSAETGRVVGFVHGYRAEKIREQIANVSMIQQQLLQPLGIGTHYVENLNAVYSLAIKLDCIRLILEGFGVTL